jgi:hypothetical protein
MGKPPEGYTPFNVNLGRFADTGSSYHPGAATGGLLGLTVSQHKEGERPDDRTAVRKVSDYLYGVVPSLTSQLKNLEYSDIPGTTAWFEDLGYEDIPGTTAYLEKLIGTDKIAPFIEKEILTPTPETTVGENFPHLSLSDAASGIAQLQSGLVGHGGSDTGVSTGDVHDQRLNIADPNVSFGAQISPEIIEANIAERKRIDSLAGGYSGVEPLDQVYNSDAAAKAEAAALAAVDDPNNGDVPPPPPPDPFALPDLPEGYDTTAWESAQKQYLDALKAEAEGGDQDKWGALTQLGLNLMSETPQYEGESLLAIAGRAGKEPLAALQAAQKEQKAARLGYLKANVDIEGQRANLKSNAEQKKFDNILRRFMAGVALTEAEYKLLGLKHPKGDAVSLTAAEREGYQSLFASKFKRILGKDINRYATEYARNKTIEGTPEAALRSGIARLEEKGSPENEKLMQRTEEIMSLQRQKNKDAAMEEAISEWILAGGEFKESGILGKLLWGQSKGDFTER